MSPDLQSLFATLRSEHLHESLEAAKQIAFKSDKTVVPQLFAELEHANAEIQRRLDEDAIDVRERRRPLAIEQAIVSLLSIEESQRELSAGRLTSEWLIEHKRRTESLEEFWGYLRG